MHCVPMNWRSHRRRPATVTRPVAAADRGVRLPLERPIFIVAAPRSGSTLLFETLAVSAVVQHARRRGALAGRGYRRIAARAPRESIRTGWRPSTRRQQSRAEIDRMLAQAHGRREAAGPWRRRRRMRWLEKTPKNALRIPFFDRLFRRRAVRLPVARSAREPEQHHRGVEGAALGHLSGARGLGRTVVDAAAAGLARAQGPAAAGDRRRSVGNHQSHGARRTCAALPAQRWMACGTADLVANPRARVQQICRFAGIEFDSALERRVAGSLPVSRYTLTPPAPDKWRRNEQAVLSVLPRPRGDVARARGARRRGSRRSR